MIDKTKSYGIQFLFQRGLQLKCPNLDYGNCVLLSINVSILILPVVAFHLVIKMYAFIVMRPETSVYPSLG